MTTQNNISIQLENQASKICTRCGIEKHHRDFMKCSPAKNGIGAWCSECSRNYAKEKYKENKKIYNKRSNKWKENNPEKIKAYSEKYNAEHRIELREKSKVYAGINQDKIREYREKTKVSRAIKNKIYRIANKDKLKISSKKWSANNFEKKKESLRAWRKVNPEKTKASMDIANKKRRENAKYRVSDNVSRRIRSSLFDNGSKNNTHWEDLVDFTVVQLKKHLEKLFKPGMTWENYGKIWHIDHCVPIAVFNFESPSHEDFKRCWSINNLQPLWAIDNFKKGAKINKPFQPSLLM